MQRPKGKPSYKFYQTGKKQFMFSIHATALGSLQLGNICDCVGLFGLVGEWGCGNGGGI